MADSSFLVDSALHVAQQYQQKTQIAELSRLTGLSRSYLQHFANGRIKNPGGRQIEKILVAANHPSVSFFTQK